MKDLTIKLNASEASGEAYWRKRCDVVEAELARLRKKAGEWTDRTAECSEEECGKTCCICIAGEMRREAAKGDGKC